MNKSVYRAEISRCLPTILPNEKTNRVSRTLFLIFNFLEHQTMDKVQRLIRRTHHRPSSEPYKFDFVVVLMSYCHCTLFRAIRIGKFLTDWLKYTNLTSQRTWLDGVSFYSAGTFFWHKRLLFTEEVVEYCSRMMKAYVYRDCPFWRHRKTDHSLLRN